MFNALSAINPTIKDGGIHIVIEMTTALFLSRY